MADGSSKFQERMKKIGLSENEISLFESKFTEGASPGTLYATKNHLFFYSVGRKQAISWEDVIQIEKKKVSLVLNGIEITLNSASKITFVPTSGRDECYSSLAGIWNIYNKAKQIVSEKSKSESARTSIDKSSQLTDSSASVDQTLDKSDKKSKRSSMIVESQKETTKTETKVEVKVETKPAKTPKDAVSGDIHLKIWFQPGNGEDKKILGSLFVNVMAGRNLIAKDKNGKSDPFCEVNLYKRTRKTKVIKETLNPEWNQILEFNIRKVSKQSILEVVVWDEDKLTNDFMGVFRVDVSPAYNKPKTAEDEGCVIEDWYKVLTKKEYESTKVKGLDDADLVNGQSVSEPISRRSSVSSATSTPMLLSPDYSSGAPSTTEDDTSASDREKKDKKTKRRTLTKNDMEELKKKEEAKLAAEKQKGLEALLELPEAKKGVEGVEAPVLIKSETPKPTVEAPKPTVEAPKPVEVPKEAPKPTVEAPKPVVEAPKPTVEAPKVEAKVEVKPAVVVEAPKPTAVETPKLEKPTAEVKKQEQKPVETPKVEPKIETPKVEPKPQVKVEAKLEAPKPSAVVEPPKPEKSPEITEKPKETPSVDSTKPTEPPKSTEIVKIPEGKRELLYQDSEKEGDVEQIERTSLDELFKTHLISTTEKYPQLFNFLYLVITFQRKKESGIFAAFYFAILTLCAWSNFTVVACFLLFLNCCFWVWFFADHVELRLPWDQILTDPKQIVEPKQIVDFVFLLRRLSVVAVLAGWNRFFSGKASLAAAGVCLTISVLGFFVNGYLLTWAVGAVFLALLNHVSKNQKSWEGLCDSIEKKFA